MGRREDESDVGSAKRHSESLCRMALRTPTTALSGQGAA